MKTAIRGVTYGGWIDQFYSCCMQIDSRAPKTGSKMGSWYGWGSKRELNEMQNVLVWVWFYGVIMCN